MQKIKLYKGKNDKNIANAEQETWLESLKIRKRSKWIKNNLVYKKIYQKRK